MLIKVRCTAEQRRQLSDLANIFRGTVCDVSLSTMTLEIQGKEDKLFALQQLLQPYGDLLTPKSFHLNGLEEEGLQKPVAGLRGLPAWVLVGVPLLGVSVTGNWGTSSS